jgi:hypothetical protein
MLQRQQDKMVIPKTYDLCQHAPAVTDADAAKLAETQHRPC